MEEERISFLQVLLDVAAIENYALIQTEIDPLQFCRMFM
jgi:hypothetical protein